MIFNFLNFKFYLKIKQLKKKEKSHNNKETFKKETNDRLQNTVYIGKNN